MEITSRDEWTILCQSVQPVLVIEGILGPLQLSFIVEMAPDLLIEGKPTLLWQFVWTMALSNITHNLKIYVIDG